MFEKKELWTDNIAVIDIWSYKIKIANCKFKKNEIDIVSYSEKRQEQDIFLNWEIVDLKALCENLKIAFKKVDPNNGIKKIIINSISLDVFLSSNRWDFEREFREVKIKKEEIFHIIKQKEIECIEKAIKYIKSKTGCIKEDLKILSSNINQIFIDWVEVKDLYWKYWKDISISITNMFIPNGKFDVIEEIWRILWKEIITIIPQEYSITKLFDEETNVVVINIWNATTSISVKKSDEIIGTTKINIWMNDLFKNIKQKKIIPTEKIIRDIETQFFEEKEMFLETLKECIIAWLQDIVDWRVCPNKFFITWWWWKCSFIKEYLNKVDFVWNDIKLVKKIEFIEPDFSLDQNEIAKIWTDNINLLSMIFVAHKIFYDEKSIVKDILEEVVMELE